MLRASTGSERRHRTRWLIRRAHRVAEIAAARERDRRRRAASSAAGADGEMGEMKDTPVTGPKLGLHGGEHVAPRAALVEEEALHGVAAEPAHHPRQGDHVGRPVRVEADDDGHGAVGRLEEVDCVAHPLLVLVPGHLRPPVKDVGRRHLFWPQGHEVAAEHVEASRLEHAAVGPIELDRGSRGGEVADAAEDVTVAGADLSKRLAAHKVYEVVGDDKRRSRREGVLRLESGYRRTRR
mmetsp:Transcript_30032/g.96081  ORF Transcript_30032/g.96081 Transcript_30032/m.96081 type:complete len:238 (-) Transcript_30032:84-797(-)